MGRPQFSFQRRVELAFGRVGTAQHPATANSHTRRLPWKGTDLQRRGLTDPLPVD